MEEPITGACFTPGYALLKGLNSLYGQHIEVPITMLSASAQTCSVCECLTSFTLYADANQTSDIINLIGKVLEC